MTADASASDAPSPSPPNPVTQRLRLPKSTRGQILVVVVIVVAALAIAAVLFSGVIPGTGSSGSSGSSTTYAVEFGETGLPTGTSWYVVLAGTNESSTHDYIEFHEPNGSYPYAAGTGPGYHANSASGTVDVNGTPRVVVIGFSSSNSSVPLGTVFAWATPINATGVSVTGCASTTLYCYTIEIAGAGSGLTVQDINLALRNNVGTIVAWTTDTISLISPTQQNPVATYNTTSLAWTLVSPFTGAISGGFTIVIQPSTTTAQSGLLGLELLAVGQNGYSGEVASNAFP